MSIASRSRIIFDHIEDLDPKKAIKVLAVSKIQPIEAIIEAYHLGYRHFAESYIQEAVQKITQLSHLDDICWHFIGPIQSNKTRQIAAHFDWVQSVDRVKILQRLCEQRKQTQPPLNVLIQVNISEEGSKSGVLVKDLGELAEFAMSLPRLKLRGLMCIPQKQVKDLQPAFAKMFELYRYFQKTYPEWDTLSMGMSSDYLEAIKQGSNMIRIGTNLFGSRIKKT